MKEIVANNEMLTGGGPTTWEEALKDIQASEHDIDVGIGTSWSTVKQMMQERIHSYASQVY